MAQTHTQSPQKTPEDILAFWLDELTPADWYKVDEALDARIRDQFLSTWEKAQEGAYSLWLTHASGALAYIILNDQMSRNMFRGQGRAFASDRIALTAAKAAIDKGWDMRIDAPARQFFYLPLMHSENLTDQDRCVRLMFERLSDEPDNLRHAQAHREVIRMFGRFPYRNAALDRRTTNPEAQFITSGGYGTVLKDMAAARAA
ncbi:MULTISPECIES: DUF924 family protein [Roseobacteraceae]|jgi:uncharacterized protein (DUF924 family)|uniref:DUF924 domain-containing protein n=1 Tax=Celeribacter baekdonensis B30 TaxID=1208323 RepID=K2JDS7_9RHOB|nr:MULTISPECIES: DUF924 family protein [Roseobacteraceae]EKE72832.1 hypothetical protein B30_07611 [Celeribacter baekdonensis B30]KAB6717915.1 DUF924 domain-containing protein [Roseobacter sp. TSBP12]|tara:strand:+ start:2315 stop:2923 length:609 start_codon:yes stop_codon:yes gene_type:complete